MIEMKEPTKLIKSEHYGAEIVDADGTQGLKNNVERSVIPPKIFEEIFDDDEK